MRIILIFTYLLLTIHVNSQSCGDFHWNQEQIDSFPSNYPGCTEIVELQLAPDVTNLDSLYNVTKISGIVYISNNNMLDITGLNNLDSIMGIVYIEDSDLIGNFNNVTYIGGDYLRISNSTNQGEQLDFPNLNYINGSIELQYYFSSVDSFNIFNSLDSLAGDLNVYIFNSKLKGFDQLQKVNSIDIDINGSSNFTNNKGIQDAFNNLVSANTIGIDGGAGIVDNCFSSLTTVEERLSLSWSTFTDFPFAALTSVNDLTLNYIQNLEDLTVLNPNLDITNRLNVYSCGSLLSLNGLLPAHLMNLSILQITGNRKLSICDYDHICDFFDGPANLILNNNANGCKDLTQLTNRCSESGNPPINDLCTNAIDIFYSDPVDCSSGDTYTTNTARMDQETYCVTDFGEEVFFQFTPSESKAYSIMLSGFDKAMGMELYQGSCDGNVLLQCGYNEVSRYLEADSTYLISVFCDIPTEYSDFKLCIGETTLEGDVDGFGVNVSSPLQDLHIDGAILIGNTDLNYAGSIRFTGTHFQGFNGFEWVNLDEAGTIGFQMPGSSEDTASTRVAPDEDADTDTNPELMKLQEENEKLRDRLKEVEAKLEELIQKIGGN